MKTLACLCLFGFLAAVAGDAVAEAAAPATLVVQRAWSRATPPGITVGGAYFEIVNRGPADVLVAIESPVAKRVEMHETRMASGVMEMRPRDNIDIPSGGKVVFAPQGLHAMMLDLRQTLEAGQRFPLTFVFRRAGRITVEASVGPMGAMTPPPAEDGSHASRR